MIEPEDILNAKILLVDDCVDSINALSVILRMEGYRHVSTLTISRHVRTMHERHDYDLIVLDMQMPDMNGLEVMEGLREIEKDAYLPVLAITGDARYKIAALERGARDFITKPFDLLEVQKRIHNMLEVRLLYKTVAEQSRLQTEMALHDPLTGLPNRRLLVDRIEKGLQYASRNQRMMAVLYMDLDGFKAVNDRFGHNGGDELLRQVGTRLQAVTRQEDTIARIGGDEFIMLVVDIAHVEDVERPAAKALEALAQPFRLDGSEVSVTASIGIAFYPNDAADAESLLARADKALYGAKREGKNRFHMNPENAARSI